MTPQIGRYLLIAPPVMLLSGAALYQANAPFGWLQVLVVYLLATFPLCILLAEWVAAHVHGRSLPLAGAILGLTVVLATWFAGKHLTGWLDGQKADLFVRQGTLGMWCILLQMPLCLFGLWPVTRMMGHMTTVPPSSIALLLATVAASTLPAVCLSRLIESEWKKAKEYFHAGRFTKAYRLVKLLRHVGSDSRESWVHFISRATFGPPGHRKESMPDADRIELASWYASEGSYDLAAELLLEVSTPTPEAVLLLASVYKEQQKWQDCNQCCRAAIKLLERLPRSAEMRPLWVQVYDNLGAIAQEQKRYADAQAAYEEALRRVSPERAHFHFQLGRLHHAAGRPGKALHHLDEAIKLDPEDYGKRARLVIDEIRMHTPGCLLRWWGP